MSKCIKIRTIYDIDRKEFLYLRKGMSIQFEDNVILKNCSYKDIQVFRYLTDFIPKFDIVITSDMWVNNFKINGMFSSSTYLNMYSVIFKAIVAPYIVKTGNNRIMVPFFQELYKAIEVFNLEFMDSIIAYTKGLNIEELLEIQFDKDLIASMIIASKENTTSSITDTYTTLENVINKDIYKDYSISIMYKSGIGSVGQINQMLASRGSITDLNNKIFKIPMTNSFILGFKNIYEAIIESRAGAKALYLSGISIQNSEYTNRELQVVTMPLENILHGDCGNRRYSDYYIRPTEYDINNKISYKHKLNELNGKRYLDTDNVEKVITSKDFHLVGTTIKLRQAMFCKHTDKKAICTACIGTYGDTIFEHQNLGNLVTVLIMVLMSQGLLSAKHLLKTAVSSVIKTTAIMKKYCVVKGNEFVYFRNNVLNKKTKKVYLKVKQSEVWGLDNIANIQDVLSVSVNKVSSLYDVFLVYEDKQGNTEEILLALRANNSSRVFLSTPFLAYINKVGYTTIDEEYFRIDINEFNHKNPMFKYDKTEYSLAVLNKEFKALLKSHKYRKVNDKIRSEYTPEVLVNQIFDLLNNKLSVNIALIEILVYSFMVKDMTNYNYDLARGTHGDDVAGFKQVINYRSLGPAYSWDNLPAKILDPLLYVDKDKLSHPMDVFLCPNQVVKNDTK